MASPNPLHFQYTAINGNYVYQPNYAYNAIYVDINANNTIQLTETSKSMQGFYLYIKRVDTSSAVTTITPFLGETIAGKTSLTLSASENILLQVDNANLQWKILYGNFESVVSNRDLAIVGVLPAGTVVYNTNALYGSVGLYYSTGSAWIFVAAGTGTTVLTSGFITGDGSALMPVKLVDGLVDKQLIQWNGAIWNRVKGSYDNQIFVDAGGNDSTAQVNNPFRPYATIDAARNAGVLLAGNSVIFVRTGSYTVLNSLIGPKVNYYFEPDTIITSTSIIFDSNILVSPITGFHCYGYGDFTSTATNCVSITGNCNDFYIQAESLVTNAASSSAIFLAGPTGVEIDANLIQSVDDYALRLNNGSGNIKGTIIKGGGCMQSQGNGGVWIIYGNNMIFTDATKNAINSQHNHNNQYQIDDITGPGTCLYMTKGNIKLICNDITSTGSYAIHNSGNDLNTILAVTFDTLKSNTNYAVLLNGGDNIFNGNIIQGIASSADAPNANIYANIVQPAAASCSAVAVNSNSKIKLNLTANKIASSNAVISITSSQDPSVKITTNTLDSVNSATNLFYNTSTNSIVNLKLMSVTAGTSSLFSCGDGTNYITFDNITADLNGSALFSCASGTVYIEGKSARNRGHCLETIGGATITWQVMNASTTNNGDYVYHINNSGSPTISIMGGYSKAQKSGTPVLYINNVTPVVKLYNPVFVTNSAPCIDAATAKTVLLYSTVICNVIPSANITSPFGTVIQNGSVV
jgi:hypothetical protein